MSVRENVWAVCQDCGISFAERCAADVTTREDRPICHNCDLENCSAIWGGSQKPLPVPHSLIGVEKITSGEGVKFDDDKVRIDLLPFEALEEVAKVLTYGAKKYAAHNWRKGMAWHRLIRAGINHTMKWACGEDKDPETGLSHLAHAACCILFLITYEKQKLGTDDRYKA